MIRRPPRSTRTATLFPYTPLFRSIVQCGLAMSMLRGGRLPDTASGIYTPVTTEPLHRMPADPYLADSGVCQFAAAAALIGLGIDRGHWTATPADTTDRKSTRLNSSH